MSVKLSPTPWLALLGATSHQLSHASTKEEALLSNHCSTRYTENDVGQLIFCRLLWHSLKLKRCSPAVLGFEQSVSKQSALVSIAHSRWINPSSQSRGSGLSLRHHGGWTSECAKSGYFREPPSLLLRGPQGLDPSDCITWWSYWTVHRKQYSQITDFFVLLSHLNLFYMNVLRQTLFC